MDRHSKYYIDDVCECVAKTSRALGTFSYDNNARDKDYNTWITTPTKEWWINKNI